MCVTTCTIARSFLCENSNVDSGLREFLANGVEMICRGWFRRRRMGLALSACQLQQLTQIPWNSRRSFAGQDGVKAAACDSSSPSFCPSECAISLADRKLLAVSKSLRLCHFGYETGHPREIADCRGPGRAFTAISRSWLLHFMHWACPAFPL